MTEQIDYTYKLDPTLKEKWLAALRSGEYSQAQNTLCIVHKERPSEYCCLGVLGDILCKQPSSPYPVNWKLPSLEALPCGRAALRIGELEESESFLPPSLITRLIPRLEALYDEIDSSGVEMGEFPIHGEKSFNKVLGIIENSTDTLGYALFCNLANKVKRHQEDNQPISLAWLNDEGAPFSLIADIIEELF